MNVYDLLFVRGCSEYKHGVFEAQQSSYFCFATGWMSEEPWLTSFLSIQVLFVCVCVYVCVCVLWWGELLFTFEDILCHTAIVTQWRCSLLASTIRSLLFVYNCHKVLQTGSFSPSLLLQQA